MIYDKQKFCDASNKVKLDVIKTELGLVTHNGTTKNDLLMLLDWCYNRLIKGDLDQPETEENCKYCNEIPCWLCEHAGECRTWKHCKENNNSDYKPKQNYCHICGRKLNQKAGE